MNRNRLVRVVLYENCRVKYWEFNRQTEDYDIELSAVTAIQAITTGKAYVEVACGDPREPKDFGLAKYSHWESKPFKMRYI